MRKGPILVPGLIYITHGFDCRARISSVSRNSRSFSERRLLFRVIPSTRSSVVLLFPPYFLPAKYLGAIANCRVEEANSTSYFRTHFYYHTTLYGAELRRPDSFGFSLFSFPRATFFLQLRVPTFAMSSGPGHSHPFFWCVIGQNRGG